MDGGRDRRGQRGAGVGYRSAPGMGVGSGGAEDRNGVRVGAARAGGVYQDGGTIGVGALPRPAGPGGQAIEAVAQEPVVAGDDFDRLGRVQGKAMKIIEQFKVPTGDILIVEGQKGKLEMLSIGDYGKDVNVKCDALGLTRELRPVRHTR